MAANWTDTSDGVIALAPLQDIRSCAALARAIAARMEGGDSVTIDAGGLEDGDVTLVQTLVAAGKAARARGAALRLVNAGGAMAALLDRCGVDASTRALFAPPANEDSP